MKVIPGYGYQFTRLATLNSTGRLAPSDLNGDQQASVNQLLQKCVESGKKVVEADNVIFAINRKLEALGIIQNQAQTLLNYCATPANQVGADLAGFGGVQNAVTGMIAETNGRLAAMNTYVTGKTIFENAANSPKTTIGTQSYSSFVTVSGSNGFAPNAAQFVFFFTDDEDGAQACAEVMSNLVNEAKNQISQLQNTLKQLQQDRNNVQQESQSALEEADQVYQNFDRDAIASQLEKIISDTARTNQFSSFLEARLTNWVQALFNLNRA